MSVKRTLSIVALFYGLINLLPSFWLESFLCGLSRSRQIDFLTMLLIGADPSTPKTRPYSNLRLGASFAVFLVQVLLIGWLGGVVIGLLYLISVPLFFIIGMRWLHSERRVPRDE